MNIFVYAWKTVYLYVKYLRSHKSVQKQTSIIHETLSATMLEAQLAKVSCGSFYDIIAQRPQIVGVFKCRGETFCGVRYEDSWDSIHFSCFPD